MGGLSQTMVHDTICDVRDFSLHPLVVSDAGSWPYPIVRVHPLHPYRALLGRTLGLPWRCGDICLLRHCDRGVRLLSIMQIAGSRAALRRLVVTRGFGRCDRRWQQGEFRHILFPCRMAALPGMESQAADAL